MAHNHGAAIPASVRSFSAHLSARRAALVASLACLGLVLQSEYWSRDVVPPATDIRADVDVSSATSARSDPPKAPDGKFEAIGRYVGQRYRVSTEIATRIVQTAHAVGTDLKVDPILLLAVIAVESKFNPIAESVMGAKGLMQVMPRYHSDKFDALGGPQAVFDPAANIAVGAAILREYMRVTGDLADALQMYAGATGDDGGNDYSIKVIAERDRLNDLLRRQGIKTRPAAKAPASDGTPPADRRAPWPSFPIPTSGRT